MKIPLLLLSILLYLPGFCQKKGENITVNIFENSTTEKVQLPFASVQVLDARFDQSAVGQVYSKIYSDKNNAVFPDSLNRYFPKLIGFVAAFDSSRQTKLMVLMKRFQLIDRIGDYLNASFSPELIFSISASFYEEKEGRYRKLFSIDDVVQSRLENYGWKSKEHYAKSRSAAFNNIMYKLLGNKKWEALPGTPAFSFQEIEQGISRRFKIPALNDTILLPGVYKTYDDFKNNKPSVTNVSFVYKPLKKEKILYILDENKTRINPKDYWGACDGAKRYVVFKNEFNELTPSHRGFKFYAYFTYSEIHGAPSYISRSSSMGLLPAALAKAAENSRSHHYFYIDMENGKIHLEEIFGTSGIKNIQTDILK